MRRDVDYNPFAAGNLGGTLDKRRQSVVALYIL